MGSERQIAANSRNARKSTGPRSGAGKNRASRNAYRHGLTLSIASSAAVTKQLDKLVRKIANDTKDPILLERARALAQAELDLARVRRAKVALIERASAFGGLDPPPLTISQRFADLSAQIGAFNAGIRGSITFPNPSTPPLRCRRKNLTDRLRRSDGCCHNYASWSETSAALPRSETERFSTFLIKNKWLQSVIVYLQNEANFSSFVQRLEKWAGTTQAGKRTSDTGAGRACSVARPTTRFAVPLRRISSPVGAPRGQ